MWKNARVVPQTLRPFTNNQQNLPFRVSVVIQSVHVFERLEQTYHMINETNDPANFYAVALCGILSW